MLKIVILTTFMTVCLNPAFAHAAGYGSETVNISTPEHLEYMAYPRAAALAEVGWSPKTLKDYEGFLVRLRHHLKRLHAMGINYRRLNRP